MIDNSRISKLVDALTSVAEAGGAREQTKIVPNIEVVDAAPTDLPAGYILVRSELGYFVPAVLVAGLTVANGDFVNILYIKGTEPIAFQHGSGSGGGGASNVTVRHNGTDIGTHPNINFADSASLVWTATDDPGSNETEVTATVVGGGGWKLDNLKVVSPTNVDADFTTIQDGIDSIAITESITLLLEPNVTYTENLVIADRNVCIVAIGGNAKGEATEVTEIDGTITITGNVNNWEVSLINVRCTGLLSADAAGGPDTGVLYLEKFQTKSVATQRMTITGAVYTTFINCDIQRTSGGTVIDLNMDAGAYAQTFFSNRIIGTIAVGANTALEIDPASVGAFTSFSITAGAMIRAAGGALAGGVWLAKANGSRIRYGNVSAAHTAAETGVGDVIEVFDGEYLIQDFNFNKVLTVRGTGMDTCILYNEDGTDPIQANAAGLLFENLTFESRNDEPAAMKVVAAATFKRCRVKTNSFATTVYGFWQTTTADCHYHDCVADTSASGGTNIYGLGLTANGGALIYGGKYDGFTFDIFASTGFLRLYELPVLVQGRISGTSITGQWSDIITGDLRSHSDVRLTLAQDMFADGDGYGLCQRLINYGQAPDEHWRQGADELTWTGFAGYTSYITSPSNVSRALSAMNILHTATGRKFYYRPFVNAQAGIAARVAVSGSGIAGIMVDDGSGTGNADGLGANNFIRWFLEGATTGNWTFAIERRTGGGAVTKTSFCSVPPGNYYGIALIYGIGTRWTNWSCTCYLLAEGTPSAFASQVSVAAQTWTPTRHGIYGGPTANMWAFFDWFNEF